MSRPVHIPRHQLRRETPTCTCAYVVTPDQPHMHNCPASLDQRHRMHAGQGGTR